MAAFGLALEGDLALRFHDFEIPAFLAFWAAARDAAEEHDWEFATHCFQRAVLDVRIFASGITSEQWRDQVETFTFDLHFVDDLLGRLDSDSTERLKITLHYAIDALQAADVPGDSVIRLKLALAVWETFNDRLESASREPQRSIPSRG